MLELREFSMRTLLDSYMTCISRLLPSTPQKFISLQDRFFNLFSLGYLSMINMSDSTKTASSFFTHCVITHFEIEELKRFVSYAFLILKESFSSKLRSSLKWVIEERFDAALERKLVMKFKSTFSHLLLFFFTTQGEDVKKRFEFYSCWCINFFLMINLKFSMFEEIFFGWFY